jgi:protein tyrosine/serine phosphatase
MTTPQLTPVDPPFIQIEGVFNVRSVGGYATSSNETLRVKPNLLFRSGELSAITPNGAHALSSLGINTIFDLRATNEIQKFKTSSPNMGNVTIVHVPVGQEVNFSHEYTTAL